MADIHEDLTGDSSSLVEALQEATDAAEPLAEALGQIRDALEELEGASGGLEETGEELDSVRDKAAETDETVDDLQAAFDALAASGPDLGDIAAFLGEDAEAASAFRDRLTETQAAEDAVTASAPGLADAAPVLEADAEAAGSYRDALGEVAAAQEATSIQGASLERVLQRVQSNMVTMDVGDVKNLAFQRSGLGWSVVTPQSAGDADAMVSTLANLEKGSDQYRDSVMDLSQTMLADARSMSTLETSLSSLDDAVKEANSVIASQTGALDDLGDAGGSFTASVQDEIAAMQEFSQAWAAFDASGKWEDLVRLGQASDVLDQKLSAASSAGEDFRDAFGDVDSVTRDVASSLANADPVFGDAEEGIYGLRQSISSLGSEGGVGFVSGIFSGWRDLLTGVGAAAEADTGPLDDLTGLFGELGETAGEIPLMGVGIAALVTGVLGLAPALVATVSGFVSFGALAVPAFEKVYDAYKSVTAAQSAYSAAVAKEKSDPTTANLTAEDKALKSLKDTWSALPAPVAAAVSAVQELEKAWKQTSGSSGIGTSAVGDITQVLRDATEFLPSFVSLGRAAEPVISTLWTDIGKNLDSSGWDKFITSMAKEAGPAASAFHSIAGGVSDFLSAFQEKGAGASNQFIESVGRLLKSTAPGAVDASINGIKLLTSAINGLNDATKNSVLGGFAHDLSDLVHWGSEADKIGSGIDKFILGGWSKGLPDWLTGKTPLDIKTKISPIDTSALNRTLTSAGLPPLDIQPHIDAGALQRSLDTAGPMDIKPKIDPVNIAAMQRSLDSLGPMDIKAKIQQVDTSELKKSLTADSGPDAITANAKVKTDTSTADLQKQVNDAAKDVKISGVEVDLSDAKLSGLAALQPVLTEAGKVTGDDFVKAIVSAIADGDATAEATARRLGDDIHNGFSAVPGQARTIGEQTAQGLAAGIRASQGTAVAAAAALATAVEQAARVKLGTQSPSTVFADIGRETVAGFVLGLEGGKTQVQTAVDYILDAATPYSNAQITDMITKMRDEVEAAASAGVISTATESAYSKFLTADNSRLVSLAGKRKDIEEDIEAADALASSVQSAQVAATTVTSAYAMTYAGSSSTAATYPTIKAALQAQLAQTKQFDDDIAKLKKEGLSEASIQSLLAAGVTGGLPVATQLLSGGKAGVAQINELESELAAASKQLGITGANAAYESGSEIGKGLAAGLRSELKTVDSEMTKIANELISAIKRALRISSPSGVMMDIGSQLGDGLIAGMEAKRSAIAAAGERMASSAVSGPVATAAHGFGPGGGSDSLTIHLTNVTTLDGKQMSRSVQKYTLQHARRNTKGGLQLQGRGV